MSEYRHESHARAAKDAFHRRESERTISALLAIYHLLEERLPKKENSNEGRR